MKNPVIVFSIAPALFMASCSEPAAENADDATSETATKEVTVEPMDPAESIDAGLAVGSEIPKGVTLQSADGEKSLGDALGGEPAVLIFTRSVDWCPFCQTQLKGANALVHDLEERGYQLFGISYDNVEKQNRFSKNQSLKYTLLSDEGSAVIDAFELRDPQYTEGMAVGVPYASIVVVEKDGKITAKSVSGDYKKRPTNDQILALIDSL